MEKEHKTDGTPCWCNPKIVKVLSKKEEELVEKLAEIEHQRWASWQKYMMTESFEIMSNRISSEGEFVLLKIPTKYWNNWERQIKTPYSELSEKEKDGDREQVRRYWNLISKK